MEYTRSGLDRGANATEPTKLTGRGWVEVGRRVWTNSGTHHIGLMSAGIAFYAFLSFVPLLGALVMGYGIVADPSAVAGHIRFVIEVLPQDAARLISDQLTKLVETATDKKGFALLIAMGLSIFSASRASRAMIEALNIIYEEEDTRGVIKGAAVSMVLIAAAVVIGLIGLLTAALLAFAGELAVQAGPIAATILNMASYVAAGTLCCLTLGAMYRFAPDRADARWQWLSIGAVVGTVLWLLATLLFSLYVSNLGNYEATYGSLGAVAVLLMWLYVSSYAVLMGGMLNAEAERQTARDSTTGPERPIGMRGATMADTSAATVNTGDP